MRVLCLLALAVWMSAFGGARAEPQYKVEDAPLKDWAVGILAADWRDSEGKPIEAFENARRALAKSFVTAGFSAENITSLSLRPKQFGGFSLTSREAFAAFEKQTKAATAGCLLYFTSHGIPEGMTIGQEGLLSPDQMNTLVGQWCGERPTVVVISACFSGVFVPAVAAPNRMVISAARPDRSSFGCSADATYPYFDGCVLESLPDADDFVHLASLARQCVASRERAEFLWPPSEPQVKVGKDVEDLFIFLDFDRPPMAE